MMQEGKQTVSNVSAIYWPRYSQILVASQTKNRLTFKSRLRVILDFFKRNSGVFSIFFIFMLVLSLLSRLDLRQALVFSVLGALIASMMLSWFISPIRWVHTDISGIGKGVIRACGYHSAEEELIDFDRAMFEQIIKDNGLKRVSSSRKFKDLYFLVLRGKPLEKLKVIATKTAL